MKPDEKYMPRGSKDLNFVPLNLKGPFNPKDNGWMPIINGENQTASISSNTQNSIFTPNAVIRPFVGTQVSTLPSGVTSGMIPNPNLLPNEDSENELFSYNKKREYTDEEYASINIEEILREINYEFTEFTDTDEYRGASNNKINEIFKCIQNGNPAVMSTFKAYRMPCPVYTVLIKKIISVTLEHCNRE